MNVFKRVAIASVVVMTASALGAFGGVEGVHAIGANHELGWRIAEYIGGAGLAGTAAGMVAGAAFLPYVVRGFRKAARSL